MKKYLSLLLFFILFASVATAQWNYPVTKRADSANTYFGVTYQDPYQWLENVKNPEVERWFKDQAVFTDSILNTLSGRKELVEEWLKLDQLQPPRYNSRSFEGGRMFYRKTMPGEAVGKVFYREGTAGKEVLLFDPTSFIEGKTLSVQSILPSYDGKMVVIAYSEAGAEISTIRVMDVATKKFLPEIIYPSWFGPISWTFDNKAFTYFSQKTGDNTSPEFELHTKTRLHVIGDDVTRDHDFFSDESYPDLNIQANDLCFASVNEENRNYIFASLANVRPEQHMFYAPVGTFNAPKIPWKVFCTPDDKLVRGMTMMGDQVYAITYDGAKNYKLISTPIASPDWKHARVTAPERKETLEGIMRCRDFLFLTYSDGINNSVFKFDPKSGKMKEVRLPFKGTVSVFCLDIKTNQCYAGITSWTHPYTEYAFDAITEKFVPSTFNKPPNYPKEYQDLVVKEVEVTGHDGVMVPLTIIHKKGMMPNGFNCCLMDSYGSYGSSMSPYFSVRLNSLAVKGVVIAIPHVRGGSEKGEAWYKAGYKTTKPNTWKDFISCAEYMIANGYTRSDRLAGTGTSAGGILISRAVTERPELFAAAICNVGCANAMRMEFAPNGPANIPEFGTVKDSVECRALYEMDGVQHVKEGAAYPAVICIGGWNDPRVIAWEPGKFAAALQHASSSGKPVLMKVNYDNGHFTEDKKVTYANFADQFAFVLWQCGHEGFQPKSK